MKLSTILFISLLQLLLFSIAFAVEKGTFQLQPDGTIQINNLQFSSMEEYVLSDYFKEQGGRCGAATPVRTADDRLTRAVQDCTLSLTHIRDEYWLCNIRYLIPVWFHVLSKTDGTGNISDRVILDQLAVLNEDFRGLGDSSGGFDVRIQFTLAGITRTVNNQWFNDIDYGGFTLALNRDPARNVNVYINSASGLLGYATYPQANAGKTGDGLVINYRTIGGRNNGFEIYDQGRTLVHEMGHYLGLLHTFEGGNCLNNYGNGDLLVDTPAERAPHYDCVQNNSCNTPDPIDNFMDYTPDSCMARFTAEQGNRLICSLVNYRPALFQVVQESGGICRAMPPPRGSSIMPDILLPLLLRERLPE